MKRILLVGALLAVVLASVVIYLYLKPTAAASAPIQAIPLATATSSVVEPTLSQSESTPQGSTTTPKVIQAEPTSPAGTTIFEIDPSKSKVRFIIDEILNGSPKTVIGETNQISGQISIDTQVPLNTRIGEIQVNTRTLTTDNEFRNRAIKNRILMTDQFEYAKFSPTQITGLPAQVNLGETITFQITGNLTVKDVTQQVTFDAQVNPITNQEINGKASTKVKYKDFGITIPNVPSVTGVSDEVLLEIEFTALAIE